MLLDGKTAVVYGAAGAVGSSVATAFAREGAYVYLVGRNGARLDVVAGRIADIGGEAIVQVADATDERQVTKHLRQVDRERGSVDVSFNAISVDHIQGVPLSQMSIGEVVDPVAGRVATHLITARAAAEHMTRHDGGVIMTFSADAARLAYRNVGSFGIACAAVEALTRSLAAEFGPYGIRVLCIRSMGSPDAPGVEAAWEQVFDHTSTRKQRHDDRAARTLLGHSPTLAEVGNVAALMASDYASPLTATVINVTCGEIPD